MGIRFFVGHGASGSAASMAPHVEGLRRRGIEAEAIDLPLKKAEAAVVAMRSIVPDRPGPDGTLIAVGGQSYGGRVASLAAAEPDTDYAGLVLFSYPLHAPGAPDRATEPWAASEPAPLPCAAVALAVLLSTPRAADREN